MSLLKVKLKNNPVTGKTVWELPKTDELNEVERFGNKLLPLAFLLLDIKRSGDKTSLTREESSVVK